MLTDERKEGEWRETGMIAGERQQTNITSN